MVVLLVTYPRSGLLLQYYGVPISNPHNEWEYETEVKILCIYHFSTSVPCILKYLPQH